MSYIRLRNRFLQKRKAVKEVDYKLGVKIYIAREIDTSPLPYPFGTDNFYQVIMWIDPKDQYGTRMVRCLSDPRFNQQLEIPVDAPADFLNVEVVKYFSRADPGPSNGTVLMGRVRIPFPRSIGVEKKGWAKLMSVDNGVVVPKGQIGLSLQLIEVKPRHYRRPDL